MHGWREEATSKGSRGGQGSRPMFLSDGADSQPVTREPVEIGIGMAHTKCIILFILDRLQADRDY